MSHIRWTIPGATDVAASFGPAEGDEEAFLAAQAAMLAGWVVRFDNVRTLSALRTRLRRDGESQGRQLHLKTRDEYPASVWAWWSAFHSPAVSRL